MKKLFLLICTMATMLLFASCSDDDAPRATVQMPVSLILPAEQLATRTPGDPGTWEEFLKPNYLYLYVVLDDKVTTLHRSLNDGWTKTVLTEGGDPIYRYNGNISVVLPMENHTSGRVYVAVSYNELTLSVTPTTEDEVKSLTFTLPENDGVVDDSHLQDIYSSPYNLMETVNNVEQYYGTIKDLQSAVPNVTLTLFHVAAKVDLLWNVADDVQSDIRLTDNITVNRLSRTGYLFCPNENDVPTNDAATYTREIPINTGNQWDGRAYFYAIPYSEEGKYPITLTITKKSATDEIATKEVALNIPYTTENPYTHWMRGDIRINSWKTDDEPKKL